MIFKILVILAIIAVALFFVTFTMGAVKAAAHMDKAMEEYYAREEQHDELVAGDNARETVSAEEV